VANHATNNSSALTILCQPLTKAMA